MTTPTPFLMSPSIEAELSDLFRLASRPERVIPLERIKQAAKGFDPDTPQPPEAPPSVVPLDQTIELPLGWKVSITVEVQPEPFGRSVHLSMSSPAPGRVPSPEAVAMVLPACGFSLPLSELLRRRLVWTEQYSDSGQAVNVIEPLPEPPPDPLGSN